MTRYKILDELLGSRYHNYSLDDLTEEVSNRLAELYPESEGVVRRTIEKDIHYLEKDGPFMVEIERYSVQGYNREKQRHFPKQCLRYAEPHFSIFKKEMTDDEEYLLSEALTLLGQFDGLPNFDALEGLRLGLVGKKRRAPIISFTKNPLANSNILGELFTAISQRVVVRLSYHKFTEPGVGKSVIIHPYLLKEYNRRWYLLCGSDEDGKLLIFALDRIDAVEQLTAHKYAEYKGDVTSVFKEIIGVTLFDDSPLYQICFWVSDHSKDYVVTKPLHESQAQLAGEEEEKLRRQYPRLKGGRFFHIACRDNYELIRELSSFGKELLVLSPKEIQDKVVLRLAGMLKDYEELLKSGIQKKKEHE